MSATESDWATLNVREFRLRLKEAREVRAVVDAVATTDQDDPKFPMEERWTYRAWSQLAWFLFNHAEEILGLYESHDERKEQMARELPKPGEEILVYATVVNVTADAWGHGPDLLEVETHCADGDKHTAWTSWWEPTSATRQGK